MKVDQQHLEKTDMNFNQIKNVQTDEKEERKNDSFDTDIKPNVSV